MLKSLSSQGSSLFLPQGLEEKRKCQIQSQFYTDSRSLCHLVKGRGPSPTQLMSWDLSRIRECARGPA